MKNFYWAASRGPKYRHSLAFVLAAGASFVGASPANAAEQTIDCYVDYQTFTFRCDAATAPDEGASALGWNANTNGVYSTAYGASSYAHSSFSSAIGGNRERQ